MTKLKTMLGLCVLSALAINAFAAQGASAANQTVKTCVPAEGIIVEYKDAHCKEQFINPNTNSKGFRFVTHAVGESKSITLTNVTTGTTRSTGKLKSVQSGVTLELQSTEVEGTGTMENKEEGATMWAQGTGTITFKSVTVTAPAGKGCVVKGGEVKTNKLVGTTKGLTNQLKFSPESGAFAEFTVEGCSVTPLNHKYEATGSVVGNTSGATTTFTHTATTEQGTLFLFGQKAGPRRDRDNSRPALTGLF
jgi:hypothetical protein